MKIRRTFRYPGIGTHHGLTLVLDANIEEYYCASTSSPGFKVFIFTRTCCNTRKLYKNNVVRKLRNCDCDFIVVGETACEHYLRKNSFTNDNQMLINNASNFPLQ